MKTSKTNKKAISLIVLVITIIVMIILAGTIILTLNNSGIIDKAREALKEYDLDEVQTLASMLWSEAYVDEIREQKDLEIYVKKGLANYNIDLDVYVVTVTESGVDVVIIPEAWRGKVVNIVDGVPIPKGFVASQATGENTKNGGLVIYEGTEVVTDKNLETAKRKMNQYVWVPVAKKDFVTKFVRQNFGESYTISNTLGTDYWEVVIDMSTNMPLSTSGINDTNYMTSTTLKEVQAMYESVKEYEGFYIARYEAGIDNQRKSNNGVLETNVYSMMGKIPYTLVPWAKNNSMSEDIGGAVEVARNIYPETNSNYGVVSTLTYGVQWDRTLAWWLEVKAKDGAGNIVTSVTDSTAYGNYRNHVITKEDLNDGARYALYNDSDNDKILGNYQDYQQVESIIKEKGTPWALSTGALKAASVNNIYDMAGNMNEWTMEGLSNMYRVYRGGNYYYAGSLSQSGYPVSNRVVSVQPDYAHFNIGLRISLYIKK